MRRAQEREDRREPSPQWYLDRVEERQLSRADANWYVRAMRRHDMARITEPPAVDSDQRPVKGHH